MESGRCGPLPAGTTRDLLGVALDAILPELALLPEVLGHAGDSGKNLVVVHRGTAEKLLDPRSSHEWYLDE